MSRRRRIALLSLAAGLLLAPGARGADVTPPLVTFAVSGTAGLSSWYTSKVTVSWSFSDPDSGIVSSSGCDTTTITSDTAGTRLTCSATNGADITSSVSVTIKRDATAPEVTGAIPERSPDGAGWYARPVAVSFTGADATAGIDGCVSTTYSGPDSGNASVSGTCRDKAGNASGSRAFTLRYDATPPSVSEIRPERPPDSGEWYTRAVGFGFGGADAASGVESCSTTTYAGPDSEGASVTGTCRDRAGNTSAPRAFAFKFDATAPVLAAAAVDARNRLAVLRWRAVDAELVEVVRTPGRNRAARSTVYRGKGANIVDRNLRNGVRYRYTVIGYDRAGNSTRTTLLAVPRALFEPDPGARVGARPLLAWGLVRGARFYNLQLHRNGRKILTVWPRGGRYRPARLAPGRYRWYVWPALGGGRYGRLLGTSTFVVSP